MYVSGVLYYWFQTLISYHTVKVGLDTKYMFVFRLAVSCVLTLTGVGFPFLTWFSYTEFSDSNNSIKVATWKAEENGYSLHVINSAVEWIASLSFAIYAASFYKDFKTFSLEVYCVQRNELKVEKHEDCAKVKRSNDEYGE